MFSGITIILLCNLSINIWLLLLLLGTRSRLIPLPSGFNICDEDEVPPELLIDPCLIISAFNSSFSSGVNILLAGRDLVFIEFVSSNSSRKINLFLISLLSNSESRL